MRLGVQRVRDWAKRIRTWGSCAVGIAMGWRRRDRLRKFRLSSTGRRNHAWLRVGWGAGVKYSEMISKMGP